MKARLRLGKLFDGIYELDKGGIPNFKLFSGGRWYFPAKSAFLDVKSPIDGSLIARVSVASESDADKILSDADEAKSAIRRTPAIERLRMMRKSYHVLEDHRKEMANAIVLNNGKTMADADGETSATVSRLSITAEESRKIYGDYIPGDWAEENLGKVAMVIREPVGIVLAITPFNYPLFIGYTKIIPALLAGNSVIAKPPSADPVPALMMARIMQEAGIPGGALSIVTGKGAIGSYMAGKSTVDMVTFTGSTEVGRELVMLAGIKKVHLELGGKAAAIVLDDSDPKEVAPKLIAGSLKNAGQRCDAISRVLVQEGIASELYKHLQSGIKEWKGGDPRDNSTKVGPLINLQAAARAADLVDDAVKKGARLVHGGRAKGNLFEATLLLDAPLDARAMWEEIFAPIVITHKFKTIDEAIAISNRSEFGLDAAVFTNNINHAWKVAKRLEVGEITINNFPAHGVGFFPFGGMKNSGLGREGIGYSIEEFTNTKTIVLDTKSARIWD